jgi:hypothetical protein
MSVLGKLRCDACGAEEEVSLGSLLEPRAPWKTILVAVKHPEANEQTGELHACSAVCAQRVAAAQITDTTVFVKISRGGRHP